MAGARKKVGLGAILVGAFDWYARYQTGRDLYAHFTNGGPVNDAHWWVSPAIIVVGFGIFFWEKIGHIFGSTEEMFQPPTGNSATVQDSGKATATGGSVHNYIMLPEKEPPKPLPPPILPTPKPERQFNIEYTPIYPILVVEQERSMARTQDRNYGYSQEALVMDFTNNPHDEFSVSYLSEVIAALRFLEKGAPTITPLVWLATQDAEQSFPIGEPRTLLLACSLTLNSSQWLFPRFLPHMQSGRYRVVDYNLSIPDVLNEVEAEVVLTNRADGKVLKKATVVLAKKKGKPPLILRKEDKSPA